MNLNLTYEEWVKVQMYLTQQKERENILGDVESFDITGWQMGFIPFTISFVAAPFIKT